MENLHATVQFVFHKRDQIIIMICYKIRLMQENNYMKALKKASLGLFNICYLVAKKLKVVN